MSYALPLVVGDFSIADASQVTSFPLVRGDFSIAPRLPAYASVLAAGDFAIAKGATTLVKGSDGRLRETRLWVLGRDRRLYDAGA